MNIFDLIYNGGLDMDDLYRQVDSKIPCGSILKSIRFESEDLYELIRKTDKGEDIINEVGAETTRAALECGFNAGLKLGLELLKLAKEESKDE